MSYYDALWNKKLLRPDKAAYLLACSSDTVRRRVAEGKLIGIKDEDGRYLRIVGASVRKYLAAHLSASPEEIQATIKDLQQLLNIDESFPRPQP